MIAKISIYHCWNCGTRHSEQIKTSGEDYLFWCDEKCQRAYELEIENQDKKQLALERAEQRAWEKEMDERTALIKDALENKGKTRGPKKKEPKVVAPVRDKDEGIVTSRRVPGINRRKKPSSKKKVKTKALRKKAKKAIGNSRIRQLRDVSVPEKTKRVITCSVCDETGHNARTCKKRNT